MDKKAIETLSVNAVRDSIVTSDFLDQFIADKSRLGMVSSTYMATKARRKINSKGGFQFKSREQRTMISAKKKYPFLYQQLISTTIFMTAVQFSLLSISDITD